MRRHHVLQLAERRGDARTDVVAQDDRADEPVAVDAEFFADREGGRNHGGAGMGLRGRMGVVGFVGMGQEPVAHRGFDRPAQDVRGNDGRDLLAAIGTGEFVRELAGRKLRAGDHGAQRVQDHLLRLLDDGRRKVMRCGIRHIGAERRHNRADRGGGVRAQRRRTYRQRACPFQEIASRQSNFPHGLSDRVPRRKD